MPSTLKGESNGLLSPFAVSPVYFPKHGFLQLEKHAARAWNAFALAFHGEVGKSLTAVSRADAYRDYARQKSAFLARMNGWYNPLTCTTTTRIWNGKKFWLKKGYAPCATPGTSNHGWGLAVDCGIFNERTDSVDYIKSDPKAWAWIVDNALKFGFSWEGILPTATNPSPKGWEPWHLRYTHGDQLPQIVLDLEQFFATAK